MNVRRVLQHIAPFSPFTTGAEALACFAADPLLAAAPVVDHDGRPLGLVVRTSLKLKLADKAGHEMFADNPVTMAMDPAPLIVDADAPLARLCSDVLMARPRAFQDGFIITEGGRYAGFGSGLAVLEAISATNAETSERLRLALNAARSAIWEIDFVRERLIGAENLERIYKRTLLFDEVRRLGGDFVASEDRDAMRKGLVEIASGPGRGRLRSRITRPDGRQRWVEHAVEVFRDDQERITRMVLLTSDITQRRNIEIGFDESLAKMEAALESKRAALARVTRAAARTAPVVENVIPAPELGATYEAVSLTSGRMTRIFNEIVIRDQALIDAVEAAEAASDAKSRFLASMSHELRTPLNAILGYAEILDEDLTEANMAGPASDAQRIRGAARHLLHLINEILDLSKIEAGRMDVSAEAFDVAALARDVVATVRPLSDKNGNAIVVSLAPELGEAHTDNVKLNQCLMNLLSNACKFTSLGEIRFAGRRETIDGRDNLVFEISDSGIGMSEEQLARLFQPFTQADASTTRNFGGTGLGLAITQRLARLLGGDVAVRSETDHGSTFTLHVPARYDAAPEVFAPAHALEAEHLDDSPIVLVIDDDSAARDLVRRGLTRLGFAIREATTGEAGLEAARAAKPSLIVLDIQLPDMSGWRVLEMLTHDQGFEDTPVLVLSIEGDRPRAIALGACDHIVKPADRDTLAAAAVRFARFDGPRAGRAATAQRKFA